MKQINITPLKNKNHDLVVNFKVETTEKKEKTKEDIFYELLKNDTKCALFKKDINFPANWKCLPLDLYKEVITKYYEINNIDYSEISDEGLEYIFVNDSYRKKYISASNLCNQWRTTPKIMYSNIIKLYFKYLKERDNG